MNITLSADKELIEKAREYAKNNNTTINNLIREILKKIINANEIHENAAEFENLALNYSGKSEADYKFDRKEVYRRGEKV